MSIDKIAAALKCTKRNLHETFRGEPLTLSEYIWTKRLDACKEELRRANRSERSLIEVAFRWGFSNYAHLSREFKRRFGHSPREFRARHR